MMRLMGVALGLIAALFVERAWAADAAPAAPAPAAATAAPTHEDEKPILIGLERTLSDAVASTEGRSLAGYLSAALGHTVKGRIYKTYDDLADGLARGEVDLAWINPYAFVKAEESAHVFPVVKALRHGDTYRSVLFVRADSKAKKLADLKGLKAEWVDETSTAGYLFPQAMLLKERLRPSKLFAKQTFGGTHRAVCEAVLSGAADVGATFHTGSDATSMKVDGCVESLGEAEAAKLIGIAVSDPIPNEVIAARPGFDQQVAARLAGVFAGMTETDAGRDLLSKVFHADGFGIPFDDDFDAIRDAAAAVSGGKMAPPPETKKKVETVSTKREKKSRTKRAKSSVPPAAHLRPHHSSE